MNGNLPFSIMLAIGLVTYLLHSTIIIGTTWLIVRCCRLTSPVASDRIWKFAAVAGLLTTTLQMVSGASQSLVIELPFLSKPSPAVVDVSSTASLPDVNEKIGATGEYDVVVVQPHSADVLRADTTDVAMVGSDIPSPEFAGSPISTSLNVVATLWCAWLLILVARGTWSLMRLRSRLRNSVEIREGREFERLQEVLERCRITKPIRLVCSADFDEPIATGWSRWTIVLPERCANELDDDTLDALLAHEVAHLTRGDVVWKAFGYLLCRLLPLQPLNFVARQNWERASEQLCDDWALERGVQGFVLARCLTQIVEWKMAASRREEFAVGVASPPIVTRVERLLAKESRVDRWRSRRGKRLLTSVCLAAFTLGALCLPSVTILPAEASINDSRAPTTTTSPQSVDPLTAELQALRNDLQRVDALLQRSPHNEEAITIAKELQRRTDRLAERLERALAR